MPDGRTRHAFDEGNRMTVCTLQGYLRGLCFVGSYALVGLSQISERHIFGGLPVQERFRQLLCGLAVVDMRTGAQVGMFEFTDGCQEPYELQSYAAQHRKRRDATSDFSPGVCLLAAAQRPFAGQRWVSCSSWNARCCCTT